MTGDLDVENAQIRQGSAGNAYRLLLRVATADRVVESAVEQLAAWLRHRKNWDADLSRSGYGHNAGRDLLVLRRMGSDGESFRARLVEASDQGFWRTQLTVYNPSAGAPWIDLHVANSEGRWVAVPMLARYLLEAMPTLDGATTLTSASRLVGVADVEDLMDEICDVDRQGLFLVAGTRHDDTSVETFRARVDGWTQQVHGLAQVVVLAPEATDLLRQGLGDEHAAAPWTIRTYYPGVDPAIDSDGLRHRFLSRQRLADERDEAVRRLLGRIARRHSTTRIPPADFTRVDRTLRHLEDRTLVDAITDVLAAPQSERAAQTPSAPSSQDASPRELRDGAVADRDVVAVDGAGAAADLAPVPAMSEHEATVAMVKAVLGIEVVTREALDEILARSIEAQSSAAALQQLTRQVGERSSRMTELQDQADFYSELYDEAQVDERIASQRASKLEDENRWLRGRLVAAQDHDAAYAVAPASVFTAYPEDFHELNSRWDELEPHGIVFTGSSKELLSLSDHDTVGRLVSVAWDCLLALADYVRARREGQCDTGVKQYLLHTPQGFRSVPQNKFAEKETAVTMQAWGQMREFPVPLDVSASGRAAMEAHFKLGRVGMVSPRIYYLDQVATHDAVFVGYIGAHLRNTQTN